MIPWGRECRDFCGGIICLQHLIGLACWLAYVKAQTMVYIIQMSHIWQIHSSLFQENITTWYQFLPQGWQRECVNALCSIRQDHHEGCVSAERWRIPARSFEVLQEESFLLSGYDRCALHSDLKCIDFSNFCELLQENSSWCIYF